MRNAERETRRRIRAAVKEYMSESEHEGTEVSVWDFALYIMFGVLSNEELQKLMKSVPNIGLLKGNM